MGCLKAQFNPSTLKALYKTSTAKAHHVEDLPYGGSWTLVFAGVTECTCDGVSPWPSNLNTTFTVPYDGRLGTRIDWYVKQDHWYVYVYGHHSPTACHLLTIVAYYLSGEAEDCAYGFAIGDFDWQDPANNPIDNPFEAGDCCDDPGYSCAEGDPYVMGYGGNCTFTWNEP
jgi:hypothetical protein